jgi:hypothetical protein
MAIVMGLDQHRAQITAEWIDTDTGEISRARVAPADRPTQQLPWINGRPFVLRMNRPRGWYPRAPSTYVVRHGGPATFNRPPPYRSCHLCADLREHALNGPWLRLPTQASRCRRIVCCEERGKTCRVPAGCAFVSRWVRVGVQGDARPVRQHASACDNSSMTRAELHEMVDRLPDEAVDGAAVLLGEITAGRIDADQAWFWTREWQTKEREADADRLAGRATGYDSDEELLAALDARTKPLDAEA